MNSRAKGLKILHFLLQSNHIHFIIEAVDNQILERGMRSLTVTLAKGFSRGRIQIQRYHLHVLKTLRETKNAIYYVLFNEQKHSGKKVLRLDGYSSIYTLNARRMAKKNKLTLIMGMIEEINFLDTRCSFLSKIALNQLI